MVLRKGGRGEPLWVRTCCELQCCSTVCLPRLSVCSFVGLLSLSLFYSYLKIVVLMTACVVV